jgi:DNA replication protein DnaC
MEQLTCECLQDNLTRLKLVRAAEVLETVVSRSEESQASYLAFLDHLLEEEVAAREKRRIQTALKIAGLPFAKTIEEYDFLFHPHLDKKAVIELFDLTFLARHENVIFLGPPGPDTYCIPPYVAVSSENNFAWLEVNGSSREPVSKLAHFSRSS